MNICYHTIFVGQETESSLAGLLWLKVSRELPSTCWSGLVISRFDWGRRIYFQDYSRDCHGLQLLMALDHRAQFFVTSCGLLYKVVHNMAVSNE